MALRYRLRVRTTLLIPLLVISFGCTIVSLLVIRTLVERQARTSLASDLRHSVMTYQNLERQRRQMLLNESALLADLPSLKALMTTHDARTIEDGGVEFWAVSGSDLFALLEPNGELIAFYNPGPSLHRASVEHALRKAFQHTEDVSTLSVDGRLYELAIEPLVFGARTTGTRLGFVASAYAIDEQVAREVSQAAAAEVAFTSGQQVVASTLNPDLQQQFLSQLNSVLHSPPEGSRIHLGDEDYLAASVCLQPTSTTSDAIEAPQLIVLKSFAQSTEFIGQVNRWVLTLGLLALLVGTGMLVSVSRTITQPLEELVGGTRALAHGDFDYKLSEHGASEIRELSRAFDRMRVQLQSTQKDLIDSERLATIGRMASSISHDLRHYLSAMYANAEFMSDGNLAQPEREELLQEVKDAVQGMTDLLDSLLLFTQTGRALHPEYQSIAVILQRAVNMVRSHPAARDVRITVSELSSLTVWVDEQKLGRTVYNILLNACQAARRGHGPAAVSLSLLEDEDAIHIRIADNGPGVPEAIRQTIFLPFVSEGRESGIGLGLTLAQQIAQEHGGSITLSQTAEENTVFTITIPKAAAPALSHESGRRSAPTQAQASIQGRG
ncbi:sensor histidine kinase [Edaphobacter aggregans]|uniref:sensor histidine kinase n=1 Tax=Edaphobacter aggregans TaxID=570835 RepID=UPI00054D9E34|nr:ATP-binding protein [Edaphobacter aggregans]